MKTAIKENGKSLDFCCKKGWPSSHSPIKNKNVCNITTHYITATLKWNRTVLPCFKHLMYLKPQKYPFKLNFLLKPLIYLY